MAHEALNIGITREWAKTQAKAEPESGVTSVGGLAHRISELEHASDSVRRDNPLVRPAAMLPANPGRKSLGKFIELSRRQRRMSVEQLAGKANVDLAELLAIEKGEDIFPEPRTIHQLSQILGIRVEPLMELAGLVVAKSGLTESAVRFAARSEPMDALTKEEEEALNWFVNELSK